jgi:hypothetical protein
MPCGIELYYYKLEYTYGDDLQLNTMSSKCSFTRPYSEFDMTIFRVIVLSSAPGCVETDGVVKIPGMR